MTGTLKWPGPIPGLSHGVKLWLAHCLLSGAFVWLCFGFKFLIFIFIYLFSSRSDIR